MAFIHWSLNTYDVSGSIQTEYLVLHHLNADILCNLKGHHLETECGHLQGRKEAKCFAFHAYCLAKCFENIQMAMLNHSYLSTVIHNIMLLIHLIDLILF